MPNWVYNNITITGDTDKVNTLRDYLAREQEIDGKIIHSDFSFWSIFAPTNLEAYHEVVGTNGRESNDPEGWYGWNCANWGTKWDTGDVEFSQNTLEELSVIAYGFETAWSHPEPIMDWLLEYCQMNNIGLYWHFEEEQGWGGTMSYDRLSGATLTTSWDIPESHAEWEGLGKECVCSWHGESVYGDCPETVEV